MTAATGVGSMPGRDSREAVHVIAGELADLPHIPELPNRGAGADMIGRTLGMMSALASDFSATAVPTGWRLDRSGADMRRARSWLGEDLDHCDELLAGTNTIKVQLAGPWTVCASLEAANGERALSDQGLCRDIGDVFIQAAIAHANEVQRRLGAQIILQVDEPSLPSVLRGHVRTASGYSVYRPVETATATTPISRLVEGSPYPVVLHSCAADFPFEVATKAGVAGISLPVTNQTDFELATWIESGKKLYAGVTGERSARAAAELLSGIWHRTGLVQDWLTDVVITPTCGLAGYSPSEMRQTLAATVEVAAHFGEH